MSHVGQVDLKIQDTKVSEAIALECKRKNEKIELIVSEIFVSKEVM